MHQHMQEQYEPALPQPIDGFPDFGRMKLQSIMNARDLGGLPAFEGRRIKPKRLYRSSDLNPLSALDAKTLKEELDLQHVIDLRTKTEIQNAEDPIMRLPYITYLFCPVLNSDEIALPDFKDLKVNLHGVMGYLKDAHAYMQELYVHCVMTEQGQHAYRTFLHSLLEATEGATLWHCTQGKDRTGLAAMLVEHALGVSEQDIKQDYLATNLFMDGWTQKLQQFLEAHHVAKTVNSDLEAYIYADMDNLESALNAIKNEFGDLDAYMKEALSFGEQEKERLRELYLEAK